VLKTRCGACGQEVAVPEEYVGRTVKCPTCKAGVLVVAPILTPSTLPPPAPDKLAQPIASSAPSQAIAKSSIMSRFLRGGIPGLFENATAYPPNRCNSQPAQAWRPKCVGWPSYWFSP
jgi:DNA-directed RNA polymerase subunit RPC12/RpoP